MAVYIIFSYWIYSTEIKTKEKKIKSRIIITYLQHKYIYLPITEYLQYQLDQINLDNLKLKFLVEDFETSCLRLL